MTGSGGHSVLLVPVPELEEWVRARTAEHDPAYVSDDPAFTHAHVTALGPFLPEPSGAALARVAEIAAATEPSDFVLGRVATFPDGIVHLRSSPAGPFVALTARLAEAFPQCPPYAGAHPEVVPHLTLDALAPGVDETSVRASLGGLIPARCRAERLELTWWQSNGCRVLRTWPLGLG